MKVASLPLQKEQTANLALAALITGAVTISTSAIFVRISEVGPIATAFWRMALAFPAFWLWMKLERRPAAAVAPQPSRSDYRWLLLAGIFFSCDLMTWHLSIKFTAIANSVLLANFAPVFVTLGGWLIFRQRVTRLFVVGMLVALTGATMLVGVSFSMSVQRMFGDGLAMTTAVFYGGYILSISRLRNNLSTATVMTWAAGVSALILLPAALLAEGNPIPPSFTGWAVLLGLALFSHTAGQGLITFALAHLPASFSSVTLLLQPVLSAVFAWLLLSEALTPFQILGGVIVLAGIFVARRASW